MKRFLKLLGLLLAAVVITALTRVVMAGDWRQASRQPTGIAPDPALTKEAVVQVYVARAFGWRGVFGVHSWIAVKPTNAAEFTVYEVLGWRVLHGGSAVRISNRPPDARWFGAAPKIVADIRGDGVDAIIKRIDYLARAYPRPRDYTVWPGPNSNTFTAYIGRAVPELKMDLPPTAIGKDFLINGFAAAAPSGTGYQVSLFGVLGLLAAKEEGVEINIFGLVFGFDTANPAIKLPIVGRIGL
ncbi:MAG TPA: DUF3750 domain-containing protein [Alphaproteobacteria bacterium]|nr:DUF3750 domain-containing protein [Alphaproteobacteria bacterium]